MLQTSSIANKRDGQKKKFNYIFLQYSLWCNYGYFNEYEIMSTQSDIYFNISTNIIKTAQRMKFSINVQRIYILCTLKGGKLAGQQT